MTDSYDLDQKRANLHTLRRHEAFEFVEAHVMDTDLDLDQVLDGVEYVFHLAARSRRPRGLDTDELPALHAGQQSLDPEDG